MKKWIAKSGHYVFEIRRFDTLVKNGRNGPVVLFVTVAYSFFGCCCSFVYLRCGTRPRNKVLSVCRTPAGAEERIHAQTFGLFER